MNNAVILQCARGEHLRLLDLTAQHNSDYARAHGMDYWRLGGLQSVRHPFWDKILLIRIALQFQHYEYLVWLDADTVIVRPEEDLHAALPADKWIGMVRHYWTSTPHENAGVIFLRNSARATTFFEQVWNQWPLATQKIVTDERFVFAEDQEAIRITLEEWGYDGFAPLPDQWNSTVDVNWASDAIIMAWHGYFGVAERHAQMKTVLADLQPARKNEGIVAAVGSHG